MRKNIFVDAWALGAILLLIAHPGVFAHARQQQFRSGVELVSLPVTVEDRDGRLVTDLVHEDFVVFEDNVEQEIAIFSNEPQPIALAAVVDFSASMRGERRDAALAAVENIGRALTPGDQWSLFAFADRTAMAKPWGTFANSDIMRLRTLSPAGGTRLFDAVQTVQAALHTAPHRKRALLVISDGNDLSTQIGGDYSASLDSLSHIDGSEQRAVSALRSGEALLYAFGMDWPYQRQSSRHRGPSERVDRRALERLAAPTGGKVWMARTRQNLQDAARQLTEELRRQYTLGYSPVNPPDGKYRRIRVMTRHDEYRVRARSGYVAAKR